MLLAKATLRVCGAGCSQRRGASPGRGGFFLMLRRVRWLPRTLPAWSAGIRSQEQSARRPARMELPATCNKRPRRQGKSPPDGAQCGDGVLCCFCVAQRPHAPPRVRGPCVLHGFASIRIHAIHCISLRKQMDLYDGFAQLYTTGGATRGGRRKYIPLPPRKHK